jgi:hypothetical protein
VETVQLWDRLPDRERGWLTVRAHWPEIMRHGFFGDGGGELNHADEDRRAGRAADPAEVAAMTEAAEWLLLVPEDDRRIVAAALRYLAHGHDSVPWTKLRRSGSARSAPRARCGCATSGRWRWRRCG